MTYIKTHSTFGKEEQYFDAAEFGRALAAEMGATVLEAEEGHYGLAKLVLGEVQIGFWRARQTGDKWILEVWSAAYFDGADDVSIYDRPKFPRIKLNPCKSLAKIAADIRKRILEPSRELVAQTRAKLNAKYHRQSAVQNAIATLTARFPALSVHLESNGEAATFSHFSPYVSGKINYRGRIEITTSSLESAAALDVLALCLAHGSD